MAYLGKQVKAFTVVPLGQEVGVARQSLPASPQEASKRQPKQQQPSGKRYWRSSPELESVGRQSFLPGAAGAALPVKASE